MKKSILILFLFSFSLTPALADTVSTIKDRGFLKCGVGEQLAGFAYVNDKGEYNGLDVDFCRGLAALLEVDVKFTPLTGKTRFTTLQSGEVDVLFRNTTWTMSRDTKLGFEFAGVNYYDGQGFLARKSTKIRKIKQLNGASVCMNAGTTTELNLADFARARKIKLNPVLFERSEDAFGAYISRRCDLYSTDASGLAAKRSGVRHPESHVILPWIISKEPLGPLVRHGDNRWTDIVRWYLNATITAEELGITQKNVKEAPLRSNTRPEIFRFLGSTGSLGSDMGLTNDWVVKAISAVGNYGEIFERNVGRKTPLGLSRGLNALWNKGGILYAPPFR